MNTIIKKLPFKKLILFMTVAFITSSCTTVKPYQKMYLNDSDMELSMRKSEKFEHSFLLYREGASGATGGKSGGGCGCN